MSSVDCGTLMKGFYGDSAYVAVGEMTRRKWPRSAEVTKRALYKGVAQAGSRQSRDDVAQRRAGTSAGNGYSVVRELVGHGLVARCTVEPRFRLPWRPGQGPSSQRGWSSASEPARPRST